MIANIGIKERFSVILQSTPILRSIAYSSSSICWIRGLAHKEREKAAHLRRSAVHALLYANYAVVVFWGADWKGKMAEKKMIA
jgi:hypothetical protein